MAKICEDWFPLGTYKNQKTPGFYMNGLLKQTIDLWIRNVKNDWDFVILITGQGGVRVGKCLEGGQSVSVIENGEVISKKLSDFADGEKIKTISWDFNKRQEVVSESEVIVEKKEKDFYEVELENGKKVVCTMDHKLFVRQSFAGTDDKKEYKVIEKKLKDIKEGDELVCLT